MQSRQDRNKNKNRTKLNSKQIMQRVKSIPCESIVLVNTAQRKALSRMMHMCVCGERMPGRDYVHKNNDSIHKIISLMVYCSVLRCTSLCVCVCVCSIVWHVLMLSEEMAQLKQSMAEEAEQHTQTYVLLACVCTHDCAANCSLSRGMKGQCSTILRC